MNFAQLSQYIWNALLKMTSVPSCGEIDDGKRQVGPICTTINVVRIDSLTIPAPTRE